jgi:hypothetical protein
MLASEKFPKLDGFGVHNTRYSRVFQTASQCELASIERIVWRVRESEIKMRFKYSLLVTWVFSLLIPVVSGAAERPNILWIFQEDTSPWMGCYGSSVNDGWTPRIDQMAAEGLRFTRAFVPFPVCSPCRSSMAVGTNAIRFGAHEHRSRRTLNNPRP